MDNKDIITLWKSITSGSPTGDRFTEANLIAFFKAALKHAKS